MESPTRADLLLRRIKNNRVVSILIVIGTVCIGLVSFAEGIQKAGQLFGFGQSRAAYDVTTKEAIVETAKKVDSLLLEIEASDKKVFLQDVRKPYLDIEADLDSILLRNQVQPLNEIAVKESKLQLEQWNNVRELLKSGMNSTVAVHAREIMAHSFESQLMLQVAGGR
jgi:hypothetical protein